MNRAAGMVRLVHDAVGGVGEVMFAKRLADIHALGREEGVGHPPANDQALHLADEIGQDVELGRDLRSADHRRDRLFRCAERRVERLQFLFHRTSRIGRQQSREALGAGMGAVSSAECVVDVEIAMRRDPLREFGIVRLFARPEADIVEQADVPCAQDADRLFDHRPHHLGDEHDLLADDLVDIALDEAGAHGRMTLTLWTPEMGEQEHLGALLGQFEDGRLRRLDPSHIGGGPVLHRQIEVDAHQRHLAGEVGGEIVQCLEISHIAFRSSPLPGQGLRGTSPSRPQCRACGWRSPIHCRTS